MVDSDEAVRAVEVNLTVQVGIDYSAVVGLDCVVVVVCRFVSDQSLIESSPVVVVEVHLASAQVVLLRTGEFLCVEDLLVEVVYSQIVGVKFQIELGNPRIEAVVFLIVVGGVQRW